MFQSNLWQLNVKAKNNLWRTRNIKVRAAYIKPISMAPSRREVGEWGNDLEWVLQIRGIPRRNPESTKGQNQLGEYRHQKRELERR